MVNELAYLPLSSSHYKAHSHSHILTMHALLSAQIHRWMRWDHFGAQYLEQVLSECLQLY